MLGLTSLGKLLVVITLQVSTQGLFRTLVVTHPKRAVLLGENQLRQKYRSLHQVLTRNTMVTIYNPGLFMQWQPLKLDSRHSSQ